MVDSNIVIVNEDTIRSKIYTVREKEVMLDFELAEIYGYETKAFNQQVKRNIEKFEDDFMFQLTEEEYESLRSQNVTSSWGGRRYMPFAFTEQGIYMLMTVLKGELAVKQSKALIRTFKNMKDYIIENQDLIGRREFLQLSMQTTDNVRSLMDLKQSLNKIDEKVANVIDGLSDVVTHSELSTIMLDFGNPQVKRAYLILNGQPIEADIAYQNIYGSAKHSLYIIDNYIGIKTLVNLKGISKSVEITIFSDNIGRKLHKTEVEDFKNEYPHVKIKFKKTGGVFHDRYIVIDYNTSQEKIYHCGASSKDAGNKVTSITEVPENQIYHSLIDQIYSNKELKFM